MNSTGRRYKCGFIDKAGAAAIPLEYVFLGYDDMCVFRNGIVKVSKDGRFGYINAKNEIAVPIEYDIAADLGRGIVMVSKGGVWSKSTSYDGGCYTEDEVYNKHSCQRIVPSISQRARRPLEKTGDAPFVMPVG